MLLDDDQSSGYLQETVAPAASRGLASLVRSLLVDLLQNGLGRCLDEILGLLESKAGE